MAYSGLSLLSHALTGNKRWPAILSTPDMRSSYDIVIIGAGGHGLATAHYLAANHGITNIAVIESGWIGGGNTARNTTIVRSDYLLNSSFGLKNFALKLWSDLTQDLNFNLMYEPRGYVDLAHSDGELEHFTLRANAMRLRGGDADILTGQALQERVPELDFSGDKRFEISGALVQESGGVVRHDAVAWGFARKASTAGVHIFQNCPATGFETEGGKITAVQTPQGRIACKQAFISVAGASSAVAGMAGINLPLNSINVQAFVTEPVKPALDAVVNYNAGLSYISQTDKGEFVLGGATDGYSSFARRGSFERIEDVLARAVQMFPFLTRLRLMRHWSGTADIPMDGNAIVGRTPIEGLMINAGWGYAGFKATPAVGWCMAELLATGKTPDLIAPFALERFETGAEQDDGGIGPYPWLH
ncbi:sarcosine oxidase subunit beta family protein [Cochlodiniinecator piscidefendens]|uniref:sarcosine oxidase subunit beta family protein n=1 Tax=Cochlodiniinecator piscidefendens TaxID=2715756 RepID=UPI00140D5472|nr:sarcosine oxidase subunit beta family protein [Cochlodiniinecator piscidefendens]